MIGPHRCRPWMQLVTRSSSASWIQKFSKYRRNALPVVYVAPVPSARSQVIWSWISGNRFSNPSGHPEPVGYLTSEPSVPEPSQHVGKLAHSVTFGLSGLDCLQSNGLEAAGVCSSAQVK